MPASAGDKSRSAADAKELLFADYRYLADSFWRNEQTGETRVNWFIGIVTAASGGLVALGNAEHGLKGESLRFIVIVALLGMVGFGLVTLLRIIKRNEVTDGYKRDMDSIRQLFKDNFDDAHILQGYQPFRAPRAAAGPDVEERKNKPQVNKRQPGGLAHTVVAINGILFGGLFGIIAFPAAALTKSGKDVPLIEFGWAYGLALLAIVLAWKLQIKYVNLRKTEAEEALTAGRVTHAGGIVYNIERGRVEYLLVGPKVEVPGEWLLPKGHINDGEEHCEAALREVREETGIAAQLLDLVGSARFTIPAKSGSPEEHVHVKYYLMQKAFKIDRSESRQIGWFIFEEAIEKLHHDQNKLLLHEAERRRSRTART